MESLIQAAEKMFESKPTADYHPDFVESVKRLYSFFIGIE